MMRVVLYASRFYDVVKMSRTLWSTIENRTWTKTVTLTSTGCTRSLDHCTCSCSHVSAKLSETNSERPPPYHLEIPYRCIWWVSHRTIFYFFLLTQCIRLSIIIIFIIVVGRAGWWDVHLNVIDDYYSRSSVVFESTVSTAQAVFFSIF